MASKKEPSVPDIVRRLGLRGEKHGVWTRSQGGLAMFWDNGWWYVAVRNSTYHVHPENLEKQIVEWLLEGKIDP